MKKKMGIFCKKKSWPQKADHKLEWATFCSRHQFDFFPKSCLTLEFISLQKFHEGSTDRDFLFMVNLTGITHWLNCFKTHSLPSSGAQKEKPKMLLAQTPKSQAFS